MKNIVQSIVLSGVLSLSASVGFAENSLQNDPHRGSIVYYGTGETEVQPDYGEVFFSFTVHCQKSDAEARAKLNTLVKYAVWEPVAAHISGDKGFETERTYWNDPVVTNHSPVIAEGNREVGLTYRNSCTGDVMAAGAVPPARTYTAVQKLGIRTAKLDWLEALVNTLKKFDQSTVADGIRVAIGKIDYRITNETKRSMQKKVEEQAAEQALGQGSFYQSDRELLKFKEIYSVGRSISEDLPTYEEISSPFKNGLAPRVTIRTNLTYGFKIESGNLIGRNSDPDRLGENTAYYDATGEASADADFIETKVTLVSECKDSLDEASNSLKAKFDQAKALALSLTPSEAFSELDRVIYSVPSSQAYAPFEATQYGKDGSVVRYRDLCDGADLTTVEARAKKYFRAESTITILSS